MKFLKVLVCCFLFVGCSVNSASRVEQWRIAGLLPAPTDFSESIGIAAAYAGFIGDYLVVAGGSNFPYGAILEGGKKEFYADIFVFMINSDRTLTLVNQGMLPQKLSGGATVYTESEMYLVGGENTQGESDIIYSIMLNGNEPIVKEVTQLPFTWSLGVAVLANESKELYLFAGRNNKVTVNKTWKVNLQTQEITPLADLPGEGRVQMPSVKIEDTVYIFNGLGKLTLTDNYLYDLNLDNWKKLADTTLNDKPFTVAGGAAIAVNKDEIIVLGGVNKEVFDDAVTQLATLKGDALEEFRQNYFNRTPEEFNFSKQQMRYSISKNKWTTVGQLPFYGGAGPFPLLKKGDNVWLISGEIKAGVRVPEIRTGVIK